MWNCGIRSDATVSLAEGDMTANNEVKTEKAKMKMKKNNGKLKKEEEKSTNNKKYQTPPKTQLVLWAETEVTLSHEYYLCCYA
ncbi:unnamed protein product [Enterobius vermicularis]|uniref:Uncharacterized protein n=1 Tax=Enterobius vermicularis TaxID=51028 RepID=A0A0N4V894_ENTVE|nr:unnamed protein product [Enterobius vermicularis]